MCILRAIPCTTTSTPKLQFRNISFIQTCNGGIITDTRVLPENCLLKYVNKNMLRDTRTIALMRMKLSSVIQLIYRPISLQITDAVLKNMNESMKTSLVLNISKKVWAAARAKYLELEGTGRVLRKDTNNPYNWYHRYSFALVNWSVQGLFQGDSFAYLNVLDHSISDAYVIGEPVTSIVQQCIAMLADVFASCCTAELPTAQHLLTARMVWCFYDTTKRKVLMIACCG